MVLFIALAGLVISMLIAAFTQVIQQYVAAGSDYRRCSPRTMGGWASRTRRKFIWREIKFEVTFSTPRITIGFHSHDQEHPPNEEEHVLIVDTTRNQTSKSDALSALYCLKEVPRDGRECEISQWYTIKDKPWFLSAEKTIPEAKCPWLNFLEDMALTNLRVMLTETRSSYDFVPEGVRRPVASMDGSSFLTVMSLFGIQWRNKGVDGTFIGTADSGFCEIASTHIVNFGQVYFYKRGLQFGGESIPDVNRTRYYIASESARQTMFNCFDLGFAIIRTYDFIELRDSLLRLSIHEDTIHKFVRFFNDSNGWCPGVRDAIGCWAAVSLPRVVTKTSDQDKDGHEFKSVFSARSATPLMGDSPFAAMLLGGNHHNDQYKARYKERFDSIDSVQTLTKWAEEYLASLPHVIKDLVLSCLEWIASQAGNMMSDFVFIPYSQSVKCLEGILALDNHLDSDLLSHFQSDDKREIKCKLCSEQIQCQDEFVQDMDTAHSEHSRGKHKPWYFEADRVGSAYYCKVADNLASSRLAIDNTLARKVVVNRLMRGSLWSAHNGNSPCTSGDRSLECSLSSRWLQQNFTVYVS